MRPTVHRMLALDLGAESGRGIVGRFDGERLVLDEVHRFTNEPVSLAGTLVWDFPRLVQESLTAIRRAAGDGHLSSVAVDGWGVDFGLLDAGDRLLGLPIHYRDRRTDGVTELIDAVVPAAEVYAVTGIAPMPVNTLCQLVSMVRGRDPILSQARSLLLVPDLVTRYLSGRLIAEYTNATTTQCLDVAHRDWAEPLLNRLGVPTSILAPIVAPGTVLGPLLPEVADEVGSARTTVVAPASHDTASAVAAIPMTNRSTTAWISCGTWSLVGLEMDGPVLGQDALDAGLTNEGGMGGTILLHRAITGLWLLQECRRALSRAGMSVDHPALVAMARYAQSGTAFIDPDDPRFFRPRDLPQAIRSFCRETGQPEPTEAAEIIRVVLESLALAFGTTIRTLATVTGRGIESVRLAGGGARNDLLCQMTANASGMPLTAGPIESAAIGNLLVQASAAGHIGSLAEGREVVARSCDFRFYEPVEDWSERRERFARVTGGGHQARFSRSSRPHPQQVS